MDAADIYNLTGGRRERVYGEKEGGIDIDDHKSQITKWKGVSWRIGFEF